MASGACSGEAQADTPRRLDVFLTGQVVTPNDVEAEAGAGAGLTTTVPLTR